MKVRKGRVHLCPACETSFLPNETGVCQSCRQEDRRWPGKSKAEVTMLLRSIRKSSRDIPEMGDDELIEVYLESLQRGCRADAAPVPRGRMPLASKLTLLTGPGTCGWLSEEEAERLGIDKDEASKVMAGSVRPKAEPTQQATKEMVYERAEPVGRGAQPEGDQGAGGPVGAAAGGPLDDPTLVPEAEIDPGVDEDDWLPF